MVGKIRGHADDDIVACGDRDFFGGCRAGNNFRCHSPSHLKVVVETYAGYIGHALDSLRLDLDVCLSRESCGGDFLLEEISSTVIEKLTNGLPEVQHF